MKLMVVFLAAMLLVVAVSADRRERGLVKESLKAIRKAGNKAIDKVKVKFNKFMRDKIERWGDPEAQAAAGPQE
ncbi:UNVERIFIED_CONTAM: hypothetical protein K2H54_004381 [Gekko kuhli]